MELKFKIVSTLTSIILASLMLPNSSTARERLSEQEFKLTTEMHNNLFRLNEYRLETFYPAFPTDVPVSGVYEFDASPSISYFDKFASRAHGFTTFHARAGAEFKIGAFSRQAQKNVQNSGIDPVIAVYFLANEKSQRGQNPLFVVGAEKPPYDRAILKFKALKTGVYVVAVFHRKPEIVVPLGIIPFHGFRIEVSGESGLGFVYPTSLSATIGTETGQLCDSTNGRDIVCYDRPLGCFLEEYGKDEHHNDVLVSPRGCESQTTLPEKCDYLLGSKVGVACRKEAYTRCIYSRLSNRVLCD